MSSFPFFHWELHLRKKTWAEALMQTIVLNYLSVQENVSKNLECGVQGNTDSKATSLWLIS